MFMNLNLFSSFDLTNFTLYLYLTFPMMLSALVSSQMSKFNFFMSLAESKTTNMIASSFTEKNKSLNNLKVKLNSKMMIIFFTVVILNLNNLSPFSSILTSQFSTNISIVTLSWSTSMKMLFKKNNQFLSHLCPLGSPLMLAPFMVIIEMVSFTIRPLTLFLRLTINMVSGHIMVTIMSQYSFNSTFMFSLLCQSMAIFLSLKILVSFIQGYIITILASMYFKESNQLI